jgi:CMP-N-acetylneuraminic acid synthetase
MFSDTDDNAPAQAEYLVVIPARGGSKRLPGKNIRDFGGFPLIAHSIRYAYACDRVGRVVVSTDDHEIADRARLFGAEVIMRPAALSSDTAKTGSAIQHVLEVLSEEGYFPDGVITLQPTNPLRPPKLIEQAMDAFEDQRPDSVISVSPSKLKIGSIVDGIFVPETYRVEERSQDLEKRHYENGLIYLTNPAIVNQEENVFGSNIYAIEILEPYANVDIDEEIDFRMGEFLFEQYRDIFTWVIEKTRKAS